MLACLRACVTTAWLPAEEGKHIGRWAGDCENATSSSVRLGASRKEGLQFYCACASSACSRKDGAQHREEMSPQWSLDALLHTASALSSSISCIPVCFEGLLSFTGQRFQEHLHTWLRSRRGLAPKCAHFPPPPCPGSSCKWHLTETTQHLFQRRSLWFWFK